MHNGWTQSDIIKERKEYNNGSSGIQINKGCWREQQQQGHIREEGRQQLEAILELDSRTKGGGHQRVLIAAVTSNQGGRIEYGQNPGYNHIETFEKDQYQDWTGKQRVPNQIGLWKVVLEFGQLYIRKSNQISTRAKMAQRIGRWLAGTRIRKV